jgi:hypothetical protein
VTVPRLLFALSIVLLAGAFACERVEPDEPPGEESSPRHVVDVTALDYAFQAVAEIPSGWTTFRMENAGREPHFMALWKLPDGKTLQDYGAEVAPAFEMAYDSLSAGSVDEAGAGRILGRELPAWYASVVPMGGPGLLTAGRVGETSISLEPGTYVMECYVKTPDGSFHSELGMIRELFVTEDSTGMSPPEADAEMMLTNTAIGTEGPLTPGSHTFAVHFEEHPEAGLGNDVHVARLDAETGLADVAAWMDWMNLGGFKAPAPVEFLGGAQEMPVGRTAYFTVTLEPGRYAWVSEASAAERLIDEFVIE